MAGEVRPGVLATLVLAATVAGAGAQSTPESQFPLREKRVQKMIERAEQRAEQRAERAGAAANTPGTLGAPSAAGAAPAPGANPNAPAFENVHKALETLTPEQRKRFQENFQRWANLSPEQKKALRDREEVRKQVMEQEVQSAIQESGLQLDGDRRDQFARRYTEERRVIEEQLRKEMAEKRRPLVHALIGRLKTEFSSEDTSSAAPAAPNIPPTPTAPSQTIQAISPPPGARP